MGVRYRASFPPHQYSLYTLNFSLFTLLHHLQHHVERRIPLYRDRISHEFPSFAGFLIESAYKACSLTCHGLMVSLAIVFTYK